MNSTLRAAKAIAMLVCGLQIRFAFAFQSSQQLNVLSFAAPPRSNYAPFSELNAKFKLDNGMDDDDGDGDGDGDISGNNIPFSLQNIDMSEDSSELENVESYNSPATTFGAEAVPVDQRPANEYLDLISAPFFDWANRPGGSVTLGIRLVILYAVTYGAVCWPISGDTFTVDGYLFHKILSSHIGALGFILMFCLRLYSGWGYIGTRLTSKDVEYEESGWYDGDIEVKSDSEIARDLFLYRQDVKPVVERLKAFSLAFGGVWVASCIGFNVLVQSKPLFNEYDPAMLNRLVYDDKVAGVAAQESNGIPTYCNSRYYSAVANGGQGCK